MLPLRDDVPTRTQPYVTVGLIAACVLVFLWQLSLPSGADTVAIYRFGVVPAVLLGPARLAPELQAVPAALTVITSMFLHGGFLHVGGNMLYLWIFGNNVEDAMGHGRFLAFYLLCGVVAAMTQSLAAPDSTVPMIGASGAISGVLGAYLLLHPHARVVTLVFLGFFVTLLRLPAALVLGVWILIQVLQALASQPGQGGVAVLAHVGGFVTGIALIGLFKRADVPFFGGRPPRRGPWG